MTATSFFFNCWVSSRLHTQACQLQLVPRWGCRIRGPLMDSFQPQGKAMGNSFVVQVGCERPAILVFISVLSMGSIRCYDSSLRGLGTVRTRRHMRTAQRMIETVEAAAEQTKLSSTLSRREVCLQLAEGRGRRSPRCQAEEQGATVLARERSGARLKKWRGMTFGIFEGKSLGPWDLCRF